MTFGPSTFEKLHVRVLLRVSHGSGAGGCLFEHGFSMPRLLLSCSRPRRSAPARKAAGAVTTVAAEEAPGTSRSLDIWRWTLFCGWFRALPSLLRVGHLPGTRRLSCTMDTRKVAASDHVHVTNLEDGSGPRDVRCQRFGAETGPRAAVPVHDTSPERSRSRTAATFHAPVNSSFPHLSDTLKPAEVARAS